MLRPQHRPLLAVTKHREPGSGPAGNRLGRITPQLLCPSSGREHQCVYWMVTLATKARQDVSQEVSLAQILLGAW